MGFAACQRRQETDITRIDYHNPVLDADWPDLDLIRVGETYWLVASSINRVPGLPILESPDLVDWRHVGNALPRLEPDGWFSQPRHGAGVWAPALRFHDGTFFLFVPDPDRGVFVMTTEDPRGEWSRPRLLLSGLGVIDPGPLWTADGRAYLVFGWAKSRSGLSNRLDVVEMDPTATRIVGAPTVVIDGDLVDGCTVLEGPKFYERDGWFYLFAPAGGVTTGWQYVFRSQHVLGPYEHRTVLAQGSTDVNGPHQGAWVTSPEGEDWFMHFQDRGVFGRVVHLQPMVWADGWPIIGRDGEPVRKHSLPAGAVGREPFAPDASDDFAQTTLAPRWHWQANPGADWLELRGDGCCRLRVVPGDLGRLRSLGQVLGQQLPGQPTSFSTALISLSSVAPGSRAGVVVLGVRSAWIGVAVDAAGRHRITAGIEPESGTGRREDLGAVHPEQPLELRVECDADGVVDLSYRQDPTGRWIRAIEGFRAAAGQWISAEVGLVAAAPPGVGRSGEAVFGPVESTAM